MVERTTENTVRLAPDSRERFQQRDASYAGRAIGNAVQDFGRSLGVVANNLDEIGQRYDNAAVKAADAQDAAEIARIRATALSASGFDAQTAVEEARKKIDDIRKARMGTLKNSRQRDMYADVFNQRNALLETQFSEHATKQVIVAERGASAARAELSQNEAVDNYTDPDALTANLLTMAGEIKAANPGIGEDALKVLQQKAISGTHGKIVERIMENPDHADVAEKWIEDHKGNITPEDETKLRKMIRPALEEVEGDTQFGQFLSYLGGDPSTVPPDDGQPDADHPNPPAPRQAGQPIKNVYAHLVGGDGKISSRYGWRSAPTKGASTNHGGIDLPAKEGSTIRPPMSGKVVKSWFDGDNGGGWSVMIDHGNGYVTGYAHMRGQSPLKVGDEVDSSTAIGSVGQTGTATGPNLHFTVRKGGGKVDPEGIDWSKMAGSVDPAKVKWREPALPEFKAEENALGDMLKKGYKFAQDNNLSPRQWRRLEARIKDYAATNEAIYREREEVQWKGVEERIVALGGSDAITNPAKQIPGFGALSPERRRQLLDLAEGNKKAAAAGSAADGEGAGYLTYLAAGYDPTMRPAFMRENFLLTPGLKKGERATLMRMQDSFRNNGASGIEQTEATTLWGVVNRYYPGNKKAGRTDERRGRLLDITRSYANEYSRINGKTIPSQELDAFVRSQVATVIRSSPGLFGGKEEIPLFEAKGTRKEGQHDRLVMPPGVKQSIVAQYRKKYGRDPDDTTISRIYLRSIGR